MDHDTGLGVQWIDIDEFSGIYGNKTEVDVVIRSLMNCIRWYEKCNDMVGRGGSECAKGMLKQGNLETFLL